ncbi:RluA family pseudouridine synthase [Desulfoglaeba alkanexedens]|nr:RluA family pseudouridine synthase [Desulfoglaeba alkanexedens]
MSVMKTEHPTHHFFDPRWPVLYEDNHLLGLYKPAGLLVQGDRTRDPSLLDLAKAWLKQRYRKPGNVFLGLVHRIDRPVAGVVLFARTSKAAARLSEQFRSGTVTKEYLAVVEGVVPDEAGVLHNHMVPGRERSSRILPAPAERSRHARLSYRRLAVSGTRCLLSVRLETGRKHQIRVQFSSRGFPLAGDLRYGAPAPLPDGQVALLAWKLVLTHPTREETIVLESPVPEGWPWPCPISTPRVPWSFEELAFSLPAEVFRTAPFSSRNGRR